MTINDQVRKLALRRYNSHTRHTELAKGRLANKIDRDEAAVGRNEPVF